MKKLALVILAVGMLLSGCFSAPVYETITGLDVSGETPVEKRIHIQLPEDAAVQTVQGGTGKIYICDGYEIMVETLSSGDLNKTFQSLTGFSRDALTVVETQQDGLNRYTCVWTSTGEMGTQVGRTTVLDDGGYHYCLSITAPAETVLKLQPVIQIIFESFTLEAV